MQTLIQDLRYAVRGLIKRPGFDRCGRGTDRRLWSNAIDVESIIRRLANRFCDLWIGHSGPPDRGATSLLPPRPSRYESRPTRGVEIRVELGHEKHKSHKGILLVPLCGEINNRWPVHLCGDRTRPSASRSQGQS